MTDEAIRAAYARGYEDGLSDHAMAERTTAYKAGYADGRWDYENGNKDRESFDLDQLGDA